MAGSKPNLASDSFSEKDVKAPNLIERAKEEFEAILHHEKITQDHHKETHGLRGDMDANTSMSDVKAPNLLERAKEEFEAILHHDKIRNNDHKETHGLHDDVDANTSMSDVKAPNVFERAKEEIEAIVETINAKKEAKNSGSLLNGEARDSLMKKADRLEVHLVKNSMGQKPHHKKETHGMSEDIDENTPIRDVRAPNVFERAKEEIEALIETLHHKKDSPKKDS